MHHNPAVGRIQTIADVKFVSARGATVTDSEGREYIDLYANTSLPFGHDASALIDSFSGEPPLNLGLYTNRYRDELADKIASLYPGYSHIQFYSTGTGANEGMLRYAMAITGRNAFCGFYGSFHGYSKATASLSDMDPCNGDRIEGYFQLPYPGYDARRPVGERLQPLALEDVAKAIDAQGSSRIAGLVIEPILSKAVVRPPPGWLHSLKRDVLAPRGILLLADEFLTSGRTGFWSDAEGQGCAPDIISLGKSWKSGLPFAAIACLEAYGDVVRTVKGTDSAAGQAPVCRLVLATIDRMIAEEVFARQRDIEGACRRILSPLTDLKSVHRVSAYGALAAIEFDSRERAALVGKLCLERGVITSVIRDCIRLTPAFSISPGLLELGLSRLVESAVHADAC
ncbi:MAG: aminotransferase class III-fold pyridoxal phosphate-dependent enzyme [Phycisphaerales bacterium]|nr:aminotransferase class III-fold pyridoxal phosphate-dependent enzyme [Hyphomonadaceae bacterium]